MYEIIPCVLYSEQACLFEIEQLPVCFPEISRIVRDFLQTELNYLPGIVNV